MKNRNKTWALGFVAWGIIAACSSSVHELGDEPLAGAGGSGGSGSVVPNGGGKATPMAGAAGAHDNVAGADGDPEPCFSPTQNLQLMLKDDALGCPCRATDPVCVSDLDADARWYGMLLCEDGRWKSVPPSCDEDCFSPTNSPNLAAVDPDAGCACADEPPECVQTEHEGRPWRIALYCDVGKWTIGEDGVCGDGGQADCRVDDVTYPHGARRVPTPFSRCNTCVCDNGALSECTGFRCADTECEEGTFPSRRCVECAPGDKCLEIETGCFGGPGCESGFCEEGRCG